jgi:serine/threonine-protein kinase
MACLGEFGPAWSVPSPVRQGETLAGKYRVTRVIAEGGMGIVVAARHLKLDQEVALKFMLPDLMRSPEAAGRFLREARAAVRLQSEHVARIIDIAELETGLPYIVMELLDGSDLGAVIYASAPLAVDDAVDYVLQACEAIAEAHALGIVHRDLKPENLFVTRRRDGTAWIKVLDFGISKVIPGLEARQGGVRVTTRESMGSPSYMSPEQMRCTRDVDGRADIWSLGVILYELLTGRQPFTGRSIAEVCIKVTQDPPSPLGRANLPEGLAAVVDKCLAKDVDERYATVADLVRALAPFAPQRALGSIAEVLRATLPSADEVAARRLPEEATETSLPTVVRAPERSTMSGRAFRRRALVGLVGLAAVIAAGGVGVLSRRGGARPEGVKAAAASLELAAPPRPSVTPPPPRAVASGTPAIAPAPDKSGAPASPGPASKKTRSSLPGVTSAAPHAPSAPISADGRAPKSAGTDVYDQRK